MDCMRLRHPFNLLLAAPTGAGKTHLTFSLLCDFKTTTTISEPRLRVLWCYGVWQDAYEHSYENLDITFNEGLLCSFDNPESERPHVVVIDDLMEEVSKDKRMVALYTKYSHHYKISVVFLSQNLFFQTREMRTISLNAHYIIIMKNPRDKLQIAALGRQIFPTTLSYFLEAYNEAVSEPFSHLIIDLTPACPDKYRLRQRKQVNGVGGFVVYTIVPE